MGDAGVGHTARDGDEGLSLDTTAMERRLYHQARRIALLERALRELVLAATAKTSPAEHAALFRAATEATAVLNNERPPEAASRY